MSQKYLTVLGATGSIGSNTLDLVARNSDKYEIEALTANQNVDELAELARKFNAKMAVIGLESLYSDLKAALSGTGIEVAAGNQGLVEAASRPVDITMACIMGAAGLRPTLAAVKLGNRVALANKECLVAAGSLFMSEVSKYDTELLPVDSEHSAIFQALDDSSKRNIEKIILTASGGPFRTFSLEELKHVTPAQALKHPNWSMGRKISIDSATMMNKGLELIEALYLFPVGPEQLDIVIHPQSIIHSLVSYIDGSVIAQLGAPDMRTPIAYSLSWPERINTPVEQLDLAKIASLSFEAPDETRFPAIKLARQAMLQGGNMPAIMNAANEIAVESFLCGKLSFMEIPAFCERVIETIQVQIGDKSPLSVEEVLEIDHSTRIMAQSLNIM
ncbi:MAG: 1-deoxy-D-xylulose-5-phosphate reductoisomerase [bacterium]|nr:1-deoxy-D-xylulose-5-phosphate reductoisomerase [bacterium]